MTNLSDWPVTGDGLVVPGKQVSESGKNSQANRANRDPDELMNTDFQNTIPHKNDFSDFSLLS